jgi:hypothetical protein
VACVHHACLIIIYIIFVEIIDNKEEEECDGVYDDVYIIHIKRYRNVVVSQENYI